MARLSEILFGSRFEETYEIGGHKFTFQSLWKSEEVEVLRKTQGMDLYQALENCKIPTLARAILRIDGMALSASGEVQDEIKKNKDIDVVTACEIALSHQDGGAIDLLFSYYIKLKDAREKERAKLTNFTQAQNSEASSSSASSSNVDQKS